MMRRLAHILLSGITAVGVLIATPIIAPSAAHATPGTTATLVSAAPSPSRVVAAWGYRGTTVSTLQRNLATLRLFPATSVTGYFGPITQASVRRFQQTHHLAVTGIVTQSVYDLIAREARARTASMQNVVVAARGSQGSTVAAIQRNLARLGLFPATSVTGYFGPITQASVTRYQASRRLAQTGVVTRALYDRLAKDAATRPASSVLDPRCLTGARVLCISKTTRTLYYVTNGRIVTSMAARFGAWNTPTREGSFRVYWKSERHWSTLYGSAMPFSMFFSGGQAVHYSSDFAARGYAGASHGCINIRDYGRLHWVFDQVRVGDKVVVYR
ncbi:MAG TPA: peptidoglycan-binding protein [Propionibacteriaceae bacterium]|nr:peptidoglycan-binding protein [Propionibacteriaceae bacterium]